jgi:hypothetical protein
LFLEKNLDSICSPHRDASAEEIRIFGPHSTCQSESRDICSIWIRLHRGTRQEIVVSCGVSHLDPLRRLFVNAGDAVNPQDPTQATWFKPPSSQET